MNVGQEQVRVKLPCHLERIIHVFRGYKVKAERLEDAARKAEIYRGIVPRKNHAVLFLFPPLFNGSGLFAQPSLCGSRRRLCLRRPVGRFQKHLDVAHESFRRDRLRYVSVEARAKHSIPVANHRECSDRYQWDPAERGIALEPTRDSVAVDAGQLNVANDQIEFLTLNNLQPFLAGVRGQWLMAKRL